MKKAGKNLHNFHNQISKKGVTYYDIKQIGEKRK